MPVHTPSVATTAWHGLPFYPAPCVRLIVMVEDRLQGGASAVALCRLGRSRTLRGAIGSDYLKAHVRR
jgi:hypothetical protein